MAFWLKDAALMAGRVRAVCIMQHVVRPKGGAALTSPMEKEVAKDSARGQWLQAVEEQCHQANSNHESAPILLSPLITGIISRKTD